MPGLRCCSFSQPVSRHLTSRMHCLLTTLTVRCLCPGRGHPLPQSPGESSRPCPALALPSPGTAHHRLQQWSFIPSSWPCWTGKCQERAASRTLVIPSMLYAPWVGIEGPSQYLCCGAQETKRRSAQGPGSTLTPRRLPRGSLSLSQRPGLSPTAALSLTR